MFLGLDYPSRSLTSYESRLDDIHEMLVNTVYDGRLIYDTTVKIKAGDRVLDSATGSGI